MLNELERKNEKEICQKLKEKRKENFSGQKQNPKNMPDAFE